MLVKAHNYHLHLRIQGHVGLLPNNQLRSHIDLPDAHSLQFLPSHITPDQLHTAIRLAHGLEVHSAAVHGAKHLLPCAQAHLIGVLAPGLGAVAGDEEHLFPVFFKQLYDLCGIKDGLVAPPDRLAAVAQDAVQRGQELFYQWSAQLSVF